MPLNPSSHRLLDDCLALLGSSGFYIRRKKDLVPILISDSYDGREEGTLLIDTPNSSAWCWLSFIRYL